MASPRPTRTRRTPGSFIAYRRLHWPAFSAFLDDRMDDFRRIMDELTARARLSAELEVYCRFCRALMIHQSYGHFVCPYERAGVHQRARAWLTGLRDDGRLTGARRPPTEWPISDPPAARNFNQELAYCLSGVPQ